jgi:hypothetical protein
MKSTFLLKSAVAIAALCQIVTGQGVTGQGVTGQGVAGQETKGIPPRASPADYQAQGKAGDVTVAADFTGHSVTTPDSVYSTEDYVVVEVALFGPAQAHTKLSYEDFSLRINGKKTLPAQPYAVVFRSLKDPEWAPPAPEKKSKTSLDSGGGGGGNDKPNPNDPPPVIHVPIEVERAMELKVQKASLPGGDRPLPEAGLIFFQHNGKEKGIHSVELIYDGPAGKAVVPLQ